MKIDFQSQTPIFLQVSQGLEDEILSGIYGEEEQIPSITELSANYKINPATSSEAASSEAAVSEAASSEAASTTAA